MLVFLYAEINLVCILVLGVIIGKILRAPMQNPAWRLFSRMVCCAIALFITDLVWNLVEHALVPVPAGLNFCLNSLYFILSGTTAYLWFLFSERRQGTPLMRRGAGMLLGFLPLAALIAMTLLSYWTRWFFYIDGSGHYQRGSLHFLQMLLVYGYVVSTSAAAFLRSLQKQNFIRRTELRTLASFAVFPLVFGSMQAVLPGAPLLCVGITLGVLQVFLDFQEQLISTDPLTQLNNRGRMLQYLSHKVQGAVQGGDPLYLFLLDVDYFKQINDRFGHVQGDAALMWVADAMRQVGLRHSCFLSRYGGDEFIIIGQLSGEGEAQAVCRELEAALEKENRQHSSPCTVTISVGYAVYPDGGLYLPDFIALADQALYTAKHARPPLSGAAAAGRRHEQE